MTVKDLYSGVIVLFLVISSYVNADQKSHEAAANTLLDSMDIDVLLTKSIDVVLQLELQNNPAMKPYENTMKEFFGIYMGPRSLRPDYVRMYVETFTEKELIEINDFYSTPTGKKTLDTAPDLFAKGAALGQQRVMENIEELQYMIQQESKRITELQEQN